MLHPNQFQVNEAWITFKLNDTPLFTEESGAQDVVALMDAASGFILSSTFFPASRKEPSKSEAKFLLKEARSHKQQLPKTLFISKGQPAKLLSAEAEAQGITVVQVPDDQLLVFVAEAREGFREHFGGGGVQ